MNRVDAIFERIKNNKILSIPIVIGVIFLILVEVMNGWQDLYGFFSEGKLKVVKAEVISEENELQEFKASWFSELEVNEDQLFRFESLLNELIQDGVVSPEQLEGNKIKDEFLSTGRFPILDIKLLNESTSPVFIKELEVIIKRTTVDSVGINCSPLAPSWSYNLLLDSNKERDTIMVEISQFLKSQEADRFIFIIGHDSTFGADYIITSSLIDQDGEKTFLGEHKFQIPNFCQLGRKISLRKMEHH